MPMSSFRGAPMDWGPPAESSDSASDGELSDEQWLAVMATLAMGQHNGTRDFGAPHLRPVVSNIYPVFVLQYGLLVLVGAVANVLLASHVVRQKLCGDGTHALLLNLLLSHCVQCLVVLPMTLTVLLVQNWILGRFLCFFMPMLQDIPLHVCMLTHLTIAWDRLRWLSDPLKSRLPAFVFSCGTWLAGITITLPYPIYINYMDLGDFLAQFQGVDFCTVNLVDDMHEYMRGLFLSLYCAPTILLCYLHIHTARELRPPEGPLGVLRCEASAAVDVDREQKTQRFLCSMAAVHVVCICPLMVLRLARLVLEETYDNSGHLDLTYLMFVWVAHLPTVISPWIYATWILSRSTKDRLRGYLRLSARGRTSSSPSSDPAGDAEQGRRQRGSHRKRPSESSALSMVSSVRSARVVHEKPPTSRFEFPGPLPLDEMSVHSLSRHFGERSGQLEILERNRSVNIQQMERQNEGRRKQPPESYDG